METVAGVTAIVAILAVGAWIQAVTGFAMGLFALAVVTLLGLAPMAETAAVISMLVIVNAALGLAGRFDQLVPRVALPMIVGNSLAVFAGLWLLYAIAIPAVLQFVFGVFLLVAGVSFLLRPVPQEVLSGPATSVAAGAAGGIFGGLFAAGGPVLAWFVYRQPLTMLQINVQLQLIFLVANSIRTATVAGAGLLGADDLLLAALALPAVLVATGIGRRHPPRLDERRMRQFAAALIALLGLASVALALVG